MHSGLFYGYYTILDALCPEWAQSYQTVPFPTLLHIIHPDVLSALKSGADPNTRDHTGEKPPSLAQCLRQLLGKLRPSNPNKTTLDEHATALLLSIQNKDNITQIQALLDAGADPNAAGLVDFYETGHLTPVYPVMEATRYQSRDALRLLIAHGGAVHRSSGGMTPLHYAVWAGDAETAQLLLKSGADINARGENGFTPLEEASIGWYPEAAEMLLRYHPNVNLRDQGGSTPLDLAYGHTYEEQTHVPGIRRIIQALKKAGAKTGKELDAEAKR